MFPSSRSTSGSSMAAVEDPCATCGQTASEDKVCPSAQCSSPLCLDGHCMTACFCCTAAHTPGQHVVKMGDQRFEFACDVLARHFLHENPTSSPARECEPFFHTRKYKNIDRDLERKNRMTALNFLALDRSRGYFKPDEPMADSVSMIAAHVELLQSGYGYVRLQQPKIHLGRQITPVEYLHQFLADSRSGALPQDFQWDEVTPAYLLHHIGSHELCKTALEDIESAEKALQEYHREVAPEASSDADQAFLDALSKALSQKPALESAVKLLGNSPSDPATEQQEPRLYRVPSLIKRTLEALWVFLEHFKSHSGSAHLTSVVSKIESACRKLDSADPTPLSMLSSIGKHISRANPFNAFRAGFLAAFAGYETLWKQIPALWAKDDQFRNDVTGENLMKKVDKYWNRIFEHAGIVGTSAQDFLRQSNAASPVLVAPLIVRLDANRRCETYVSVNPAFRLQFLQKLQTLLVLLRNRLVHGSDRRTLDHRKDLMVPGEAFPFRDEHLIVERIETSVWTHSDAPPATKTAMSKAWNYRKLLALRRESATTIFETLAPSSEAYDYNALLPVTELQQCNPVRILNNLADKVVPAVPNVLNSALDQTPWCYEFFLSLLALASAELVQLHERLRELMPSKSA